MPRRRTSTGRRFLAEALENRRLLSAGDFDVTFGVGGKVSLANLVVAADAVQSDGKVLLAGNVLERLNVNGTPDETFGTHGVVDPGFTAEAIVVQPDGKILLTGGEGVLARYTTSGLPDAGFGSGGKVQIQVPGWVRPQSVALTPDGRILEVGTGLYQDPAHPNDTAYSTGVFFASRYNANGSIDTTFNGVGYVYRQSPGGGRVAVAAAGDGKVVVGAGLTTAFALYRYTPTGAVDRTFGLDGLATAGFGHDSYGEFSTASVSNLLIEPDGKIVAAGPWHLDVYDAFMTRTFNNDGSLVSDSTPASPTANAADVGSTYLLGDYRPTCLFHAADGTWVSGGWWHNGTRPPYFEYYLDWTLPNGTSVGQSAIDSLISAYPDQLGRSFGALGPDGALILAFQRIDPQSRGQNGTLVVRLQGGSAGAHVPFSGTPYALNTTIEAENFDNGGEGVSFHDTTIANIPGKYRNTTVDVAAVSNASNGYAVGYTAPGEFLDYSLRAAYSGTFALQARVANYMQGGKFHATIDGVDVTGAMVVPNTGPWDTWQTLTGRTFSLSKGDHVLRISMDTGGYWGNIGDFDWFKVMPVGRWPYNASPVPVTSDGASIEAENFDNGGEGVSFHDTTPQNVTGKYRDTGVDIVSFATASKYYAVGYTAAGEWLDYTIDVAQPGPYDFEAIVASKGTGGSFRVLIDGNVVSAPIQIKDTGAWNAWGWVYSVPALSLTAGQHVLRISMDSVGPTGAVGNFDKFWLVYRPGLATALQAAAIASTTPGNIDTSFGFYGRQLYNDPDPVALPNSLRRHVGAMAVQGDGKILLAGSVGTVADQGIGSISLRRLNADGTRDASFGTDGEVITSVGPVSFATCIVVQSDGRILVGGGTEDSATTPTIASFALERFTANGVLDPTFGSAGKVITDFSGNEKVDSIALTSTGKIVAAGSYFLTPEVGFDVVKYNADGSLDTAFNSTGKLSYGLGQPTADAFPAAVAVQGDGKILVGAHAGPSAAVFRFSSAGIVDSGFASSGVLTLDGQAANALAVQGDGKILVATVGPATADAYGLFRATPSGQLDTFFGRNGSAAVYTYTDSYPFPRYPVAGLVLQPDGKIILVGTRKNPIDTGFIAMNKGTAPLVRRYTASGLLDTTFTADQDPQFVPVYPSGGPVAAGAGLAPDGKLIVASDVWPTSSDALHWTGVARYQNVANFPGPDPYLGITRLATQPIQSEDFDTGGEGISFHDTTAANLGGKYRSTAVDVNGMGSNGFCVGYTAAGEWLDYTINVPADGSYTLQAQVASVGIGGTFHATISDGFSSFDTSTLSVPDTGGWANFKTVSSKPIVLGAGTYLMRITLDTAGPLTAVGNFDFFRLVTAS